jgi:hypothetical protein
LGEMSQPIVGRLVKPNRWWLRKRVRAPRGRLSLGPVDAESAVGGWRGMVGCILSSFNPASAPAAHPPDG